jgi:hypothetical protein
LPFHRLATVATFPASYSSRDLEGDAGKRNTADCAMPVPWICGDHFTGKDVFTFIGSKAIY